MNMKILVVNGPNLQLLGRREPEIYGSDTLESITRKLREVAASLELEIEFFQSNSEGEIVSRIGATFDDGTDGIIINPAAYTHTSVAILDALRAVRLPAVEVHLSNVNAREEYRRHSVTAAGCTAMIAGFGAIGYELALRAMPELIRKAKASCK